MPSNSKSHICTICEKRFRCASHLTRHARVHDDLRPYICEHPGCAKTYPRLDNLREHQRSHNPDLQRFPCPKEGCSQTLATHQLLKRHVALHERPTPFQCSDCPAAFRKKTQLAAHRTLHTGLSPYPCPHPGCLRGFNMPSQLRKHQMVHAGNKYVCAEEPCLGNSVCFGKFTEFQKHIKMVHPKQHTCVECGRCFSTSGSLKNHVRTHRVAVVDRLDYVCPYQGCGLAYTKSSNLNSHVKAKHTMKDPFVCHVCEKTFVYKAGLKTHLKNLHGLTMESRDIELVTPDGSASAPSDTEVEQAGAGPSVKNSTNKRKRVFSPLEASLTDELPPQRPRTELRTDVAADTEPSTADNAATIVQLQGTEMLPSRKETATIVQLHETETLQSGEDTVKIVQLPKQSSDKPDNSQGRPVEVILNETSQGNTTGTHNDTSGSTDLNTVWITDAKEQLDGLPMSNDSISIPPEKDVGSEQLPVSSSALETCNASAEDYTSSGFRVVTAQ